MKRLVYLVFAVIFSLLLIQLYRTDKARRELKREVTEVNEEMATVSADNDSLAEKIQYYSDPRNLEKELRARFNFRLPNERLIIVVPGEDEESRD
ncbi:MAG: septum formation initiator family protein [Candidatus Colwellbacteria bacterium]|nr:septum formation initiator family protein [Candidatus Colwellbacteria bacterium]